MTSAVLFFALSIVFLLLVLFFLDLILFCMKWKKCFLREKEKEELVLRLEKVHRKMKNPIKKNYLLYLLLLKLSSSGEGEKAKALFPFLKNDPLMGIKKSRILL